MKQLNIYEYCRVIYKFIDSRKFVSQLILLDDWK